MAVFNAHQPEQSWSSQDQTTIYGRWNKGTYNDRKRDVGEFMLGEMAAENADQRTRNLYNDLYSPKAQIEQIKAAGLSPSIYASGGIAGKSGQSGAQGTGGGGNSGGSQFAANLYGTAMNTLMQTAQLKSQIDLNKAQANKLNAETQTELGENERGQAEITKIISENTSMEVANAYTKSMTVAQEWQNYITQNTANYSIRTAAYKSEQAAHEAQEAYWKAANEKKNYEFNERTFDLRVGQEKQTWINLQLEAALKNAQTKLTNEQVELVKGELSMLYDTSMREWAKLDVARADQEKRAELIDKEVQNFERKLEQMDKQLRIQNRTSWFNNINSSIRTIAYSASCVATFLPTSGGTPIPPVLEPSGLNQFY